MTFKDFIDKVDDTYNYFSFELRYGQTVMNTLMSVWPDKYKELTNSEYDCFYNDGIVSRTLAKLETEWQI